MPFTILTGKELAIAPRPLLLCRLVALDGDTVYLSTAANSGATSITYGGNAYVCKVQEQAIEAIVAMSAQGYDIPGAFALTLGDGDLALWNDHALAHGWKGATLTVTLVLWDAIANAFSTDSMVFEFVVESADIQANGVLRVPAVSRNSMTRMKVPNVLRQRRCGWLFPATSAQRLAGLNDPTSPYYPCGYSKGLSGGVGNFETGSTPYTTCDYTREGCTSRGMFDTDSSANVTRRFGGDTWIAPETYSGRKYTSGQKAFGYNNPNPPGSTYYPLVYGTQWVDAVSLAPAKEPNSVRAEAVVCMAVHGTANVLKVVINGHEVPQNSGDVLFTWRYITQGGRTGAINPGAIFDGEGDPHGSMCVIEWVVPEELAGGGNPSVRCLVSGPPSLVMYAIDTADHSGTGGRVKITFPHANTLCAGNSPFTVLVAGSSAIADGSYGLYDWDGTSVTLATTSGSGTDTGGYVAFYVANYNPVWHLLDLLTVGPWTLADLDYVSFHEAAAYCDASVSYEDLAGNTASHARFRSSFALENGARQTLAQAVLGLRMNAGIMLRRDPTTGKLGCAIERTLAEQQPAPVSGSNYDTAVSSLLADGTTEDGYLAYRFDGSNIDAGTLRVSGRPINDSPTTIQISFQDEDNGHQVDSLSLIDPEAFAASGQQNIASGVPVLGIPNFDQAVRRGNVEHAKAHYGNTRADAGGTDYIEFTASMRAAHLAGQVGAICGIDYEQLGL